MLVSEELVEEPIEVVRADIVVGDISHFEVDTDHFMVDSLVVEVADINLVVVVEEDSLKVAVVGNLVEVAISSLVEAVLE